MDGHGQVWTSMSLGGACPDTPMSSPHLAFAKLQPPTSIPGDPLTHGIPQILGGASLGKLLPPPCSQACSKAHFLCIHPGSADSSEWATHPGSLASCTPAGHPQQPQTTAWGLPLPHLLDAPRGAPLCSRPQLYALRPDGDVPLPAGHNSALTPTRLQTPRPLIYGVNLPGYLEHLPCPVP